MNSLTIKEGCAMVVSDRERKQLELQRKLRYFTLTVHGEEGQPVRIEKIKESIKL